MTTSTNTNPPQLVLDPLHANARVNGKTCKMKKKKSDDGNDASVSVGFRGRARVLRVRLGSL